MQDLREPVLGGEVKGQSLWSRSSPLLARVLFARAIEAHRCDLDEPRTVRNLYWQGKVPDPVNARRHGAHVHLCKTRTGDFCRRRRRLLILRTGLAVVAPVIRMAIQPRPLGVTLVAPVIGVRQELGLLPKSLPRTLANRRRAEGLVWNVSAGLERLATVFAVSGRHRFSPYENRMKANNAQVVA